MEAVEILRRVREAQENLSRASGKWGGVTICAVTKTVAAEDVNVVRQAGIDTIGENRVQEALAKRPLLDPKFSLAIIGQVQLNKIKYIVRVADMVQSLDRPELAIALSDACLRAGRVMDVLVQVNIARESGKSGVFEQELPAFLDLLARQKGIHARGLMAIMPNAEDKESLRPYFRRMRQWFDRLKSEAPPGVDMEILSMGMSGDCLIAAQEGATMVRLGSALFGERAYPLKDTV